MGFESYMLEVLGLVAVGGSAALVTQVVSISPYNMELSRAQNNAYFVALPLIVYLSYRFYFGLTFYLSSLVPKKFKQLEWGLSTFLVSAGLGAGIYAPGARETAKELFNHYVGDLYNVLYKVSEPELTKAYLFGYRVVTLIAAWFAVLFVVELLIRVVLFVIVSVLRAVGLVAKLPKEKKVEDETVGTEGAETHEHAD